MQFDLTGSADVEGSRHVDLLAVHAGSSAKSQLLRPRPSYFYSGQGLRQLLGLNTRLGNRLDQPNPQVAGPVAGLDGHGVGQPAEELLEALTAVVSLVECRI